MSYAIETLKKALDDAMSIRPKVGGFPHLAEALRRAGLTRNTWNLPGCQSVFLTKEGPVVSQGTPLFTGYADIPTFNRDALIHALRTDQAGQSTFPEFLQAAWQAGVIRYEVDFEKRNVTYYGVFGDSYVEDYPAVEL